MNRYQQPPLRLIRSHPEGEQFTAGRYVGDCPNNDGRLNMGSTLVRRGDVLYHVACDPHPSINHCPCGVALTGSDVLCDACWSVWYEMVYEWPRVREAPVKMAFGKTTDDLPVQAGHLAMRDHLKRVAQ